MSEKKRAVAVLTAVGCACCLLLIISRIFGALTFGASGNEQLFASAGTLLVIVALCLSIHLVRVTAAMENRHVWRSGWLLLLLCMPVVNLLVTALQMVFNLPAGLIGSAVSALLVFISMPVFYSIYFLYLRKRCLPKDALFSAVAICQAVCGFVWAALRLLNDVILLPSQKSLLPAVLRYAVEQNNRLSFILYAIAICGFLLFCFKFDPSEQAK